MHEKVIQKLVLQVETIIFQSGDFKIAACKDKKGQEVKIKGDMPDLKRGMRVEVLGNMQDTKWGETFHVSVCNQALDSRKDLEVFMKNSVKGIGKRTAQKITEKFGDQIEDIMETDPLRLCEIRGINEKKALAIKQQWDEVHKESTAMVFLLKLGLSTSLAKRIHQRYRETAKDVLEADPYRLMYDVDGVGFKTADIIATKFGILEGDMRRAMAGVLYCLTEACNSQGHCYLPLAELVKMSKKFLGDSCPIEDGIQKQALVGRIILSTHEGIEIASPNHLYYAEQESANSLLTHIAQNKTEELQVYLPKDVEYNANQLKAIELAMCSKMMVLTGGPGTGKTTTTLGIIHSLCANGKKTLLAAPTGRAAKRLSEATKKEAKTIHRLLEYNQEGKFNRTSENPLEGDVLLVDEFSMVDIVLFRHLMDAIPRHMSIILVGDSDQLPSVGPGNVFRDIIDSGIAPVVRLTEIFRQASDSDIIRNAHLINHGVLPNLYVKRDSDFFFVNIAKDCPYGLSAEEASMKATERIVHFVSEGLPRCYGIPSSEIQVLSPQKNGYAGTIAINRMLQDKLNPYHGQGEYTVLDQVFREGDKVMQMANDYEKETFNGDIGTIVQIVNDAMIVSFDNRKVTYPKNEVLDSLSLAYASTIHKSQGSEYQIVVIPLTMSHFMMLQRNLLYTAVTRAKKIVVIVGTTDAIAQAVKNDKAIQRNTTLCFRLTKNKEMKG